MANQLSALYRHRVWQVTNKMCRVAAIVLAVMALGAAAETHTTVQLNQGKRILHAHLVAPVGDRQQPLFIITHGTLAHNKMEIISALQTELAAEHYASLAINLSYTVTQRPSEMFGCEHTHTHTQEQAIAEIALWTNWAVRAGYSSIYLVGHSRGGVQTAWYLTTNQVPDAVRGAVLLAPANKSPVAVAADYTKRYRTTPQAVLARQSGATLADVNFLYCQKVAVRRATFTSYYTDDPRVAFSYSARQIDLPLLVVGGSDDQVVVLTEQDMQPLAQHNVEFVYIDGADHFFRDLYLLDIIEAVLAWIKKEPDS